MSTWSTEEGRALKAELRAATHCFVGLCGKCRKLVACAVKSPSFVKENALAVRKWIADGLTIAEWETAKVREGEWCGCKSAEKANVSGSDSKGKKRPSQQSLF